MIVLERQRVVLNVDRRRIERGLGMAIANRFVGKPFHAKRD